MVLEDEGRIQSIERIFQTSADYCAELEDRETDQSEPLVAEAPVMNGNGAVEPSGESKLDNLLGKNPFPEGDFRRQLWVDASLWAKEHLALFVSGMWNSKPAENAALEEHRSWIVSLVSGRFGITACAFSQLVPLSDQGAHVYEEFLHRLEKLELAEAERLNISFIPRRTFIRNVRAELTVQKAYLIGQMLKQLREAKEAKRSQRMHDAPSSAPEKPEAERAVRESTPSKPSEGNGSAQGCNAPAFPRRAAWLKDEMAKRNFMTPYRLHKIGGPDAKTVKRILQGLPVREEKLHLVAAGLSHDGGNKVSCADIPSD